MEQLKTTTGMTSQEIRENIKDLIVETVMNNDNVEIIKSHVLVLNSIYDLVV